MTSHKPTAITAAVLFLAAVALVTLVPVDFVARAPGDAVDLLGTVAEVPVIQLGDQTTYPSTGQIVTTSVTQTPLDHPLSFAAAVIDRLLPDREVLPHDDVYQVGDTAESVAADRQAALDRTRTYAVVAALRQLEADAPRSDAPPLVVETVAVGGIVPGGPADGRLQTGDILTSLGDQPISTVAQVLVAVRQDNAVGTNLPVTVFRPGQGAVGLTIELGKSQLNLPTMGVTWTQRYDYSAYLPEVQIDLDPAGADESDGLALALALYDRLTPDDLTGGRIVAAVGSLQLTEAGQNTTPPVDPAQIATLGTVPGIRQHVVSATDHGAGLVLLPRGNCPDVAGLTTSARLVPVSTFRQAVGYLTDLAAGGDLAALPDCGPVS